MDQTTSLPGYGLQYPTLGEMELALRQAVGLTQAIALMEQACCFAGAPPYRFNGGEDGHTLTPEQMGAIAAFLASQGGAIGIIGRSLLIRQNTYRTLAQKAAYRTAGREGAA